MNDLRQWLADTGSNVNLIDLLTQGGPTAILVAVIVMFLRGDIVSRRTLDEVQKQRDRALDLVYSQASLASRAVDVSADRLKVEEELARLRSQKGG